MLPPGFVLCFSIYFLKLRGSSYLSIAMIFSFDWSVHCFTYSVVVS